jgi:hypothetical protein
MKLQSLSQVFRISLQILQVFRSSASFTALSSSLKNFFLTMFAQLLNLLVKKPFESNANTLNRGKSLFAHHPTLFQLSACIHPLNPSLEKLSKLLHFFSLPDFLEYIKSLCLLLRWRNFIDFFFKNFISGYLPPTKVFHISPSLEKTLQESHLHPKIPSEFACLLMKYSPESFIHPSKLK